ncbi:MAG: cache domain-containing protein [Pseudomonadota bacterium]
MPRSRSIQARIQQLVLVCVIPGWLLLIAATLIGYQRERDAQQSQACKTARTLGNALEAELDGHVIALQTLATSSTLDPLDLPGLRLRAARVLQLLRGETLVLTDPEGRQLMNLLLPPGVALPPPRPGVYPPGADPRAPMVSDLFVGTLSQRQQVAVHVPVIRGGELRYRLSLVLPVSRLDDFLQRQDLPAGWISSVLDRQGITMARTLNADRFVGQPVVANLLEKVLKHESSCFPNTTREGTVVFAGHARAGRYGWSTTIGVPEEALTADLRRRLATFSAIARSRAWWPPPWPSATANRSRFPPRRWTRPANSRTRCAMRRRCCASASRRATKRRAPCGKAKPCCAARSRPAAWACGTSTCAPAN